MRSGLMLMLGVMFAIVLLAVLFPANTNETTNKFEREFTRSLPADTPSPPAKLEDVSWLVGAWKGQGLGGTFEEVWNPPSANSMVGFFKLIEDGTVKFYELLVLEPKDDSLVMKVKHFNRDFSAWEEKDEYITFRLVAIEKNAIHFSGISFYRQDEDEIIAYLAMRQGDQVRELKLDYVRTQL